MQDEEQVTAAPNAPATDPLLKGRKTSEFMMTGAGLFLGSLFSLLAAFNVLTLTPEQKQTIYEFTGVAWFVLPAVYSAARAHIKASAVKKG